MDRNLRVLDDVERGQTVCNGMHCSAVSGRHPTCTGPCVLNFFMLGPHQVPIELTPTAEGCQLSLHHAADVIMERFSTVSAALLRIDELNTVLSSPRRSRPIRTRSAKHRSGRRR